MGLDTNLSLPTMSNFGHHLLGFWLKKCMRNTVLDIVLQPSIPIWVHLMCINRFSQCQLQSVQGTLKYICNSVSCQTDFSLWLFIQFTRFQYMPCTHTEDWSLSFHLKRNVFSELSLFNERSITFLSSMALV